MAVRTPYTLLATAAGSHARLGQLATAHGSIATPQFMPVATQGTVRAQRTEDVGAAGATMLLANTWHLAQRPGLAAFDAVGGLRDWMRWPGARPARRVRSAHRTWKGAVMTPCSNGPSRPRIISHRILSAGD
jgi:hypothetical protein